MDAAERLCHVVATRITYDLVTADGVNFRMEPAEAQSPLVLEDMYYGEINKSSLICESDLAPFKPRCDVLLVHANAYAPCGKPSPKMYCQIRAGNVEKTLCATGPRVWQWRLLRWVLLPPEPVLSVPLRYENAFGGECLHVWPDWREKPPFHKVYTQNPVGKGWMPADHPQLQTLREIPAPQIEAPDQPIGAFGIEYVPQGFGAIARPWTPRIQLAGTYDEAWKKERWPKSPKDFQDAYWNCASPELQIDYPAPDMPLELRGLTPEGLLCTALPGHRVVVLARFVKGALMPLKTVIDTVIVDLCALRLTVVHRARVPMVSDVRALEVRFQERMDEPLLRLAMAVPEDVSAEATP